MLQAFDRDALMSNGRPVHLAPARPDDVEQVRRFYRRLCDEATRFRFFGIRRTIPDHELEVLVSEPSPTHATILATVGDELIGIGEYHVASNPEEAEVAFAVADDHHDEGVGTLLLEDLAVIAAGVGFKRLVAQTLPDNGPMRLVFGTSGLQRSAHFDNGVIEFTMDLADMDSLIASAAVRRSTALLRADALRAESGERAGVHCDADDAGQLAVVARGQFGPLR